MGHSLNLGSRLKSQRMGDPYTKMAMTTRFTNIARTLPNQPADSHKETFDETN